MDEFGRGVGHEMRGEGKVESSVVRRMCVGRVSEILKGHQPHTTNKSLLFMCGSKTSVMCVHLA